MADHVCRSGVNLNAETCKKTTLLHINASKGLIDKVNSLLETGADINGKDEKERTPLHCSVDNCHKDVVEILLKAGANVNASDKTNITPLHCAAGWGLAEIVETLLKAGANVDASDKTNWTPLRWAAWGGHAEIVETLLKAGANVNASDTTNTTPLHSAACWGPAEIVETLLKAGANVNASDETNMTPLHWAARWGHAEIVETLLKAGANVYAKSDRGHTPLFYSNQYCHYEVSECLLKFGAGQGVWKRFVRHVSSALTIKAVSHTQSTKTVHVLGKSTDGVSSHSESSHTSIMTCEPRDGHTDVTPSTDFANDIQQGSSSADCVAPPSSSKTANSCTAISDDTEAITSVLPLGLSLQECEDIKKQAEDHWAKFPLQHKSHKGQCFTDVPSVITKGKITLNICPATIKVLQNYIQESLQAIHPELPNVSIVNFSPTERADSNADTDDSESNDNGLEDNSEDIQQGSSTAECVTLPSSGMSANSCTVISDDTEATTSALPLGLSLQECEDIRKQVQDHWAKFSLQHKSHKGQCSTDVTSVLKDGKIVIKICPKTIKDLHNYAQESLPDSEYLTVNGRVNLSCTEPVDSYADIDYIDTCDNVLEAITKLPHRC